MERTHDISYYTRCAVLKVWTQLVEVAFIVIRSIDKTLISNINIHISLFSYQSNAVPVRRIGSVAEIAEDRIHDKTALVRKQAVALLTTLMDNNPFDSNLDMDKFVKQV